MILSPATLMGTTAPSSGSAASTAGVGSVGLSTEPGGPAGRDEAGGFAGPSPRIGFEATLQPDDAAAPAPGEPATATPGALQFETYCVAG